jgi:anti-anti-sigma regulatory factor
MTVNEERFPSFRVPVVECTGKEAWGIDQGRLAFGKADAVLRNRSEAIVNLDLSGVARLDSSCARELIANLMRKHSGTRWFFLSGGASESVKENIDAAMLRRSPRS